MTTTASTINSILDRGLDQLWYAVCPSSFISDRAISLRRFGYKIALWRNSETGAVHALEDHCPHRGAPLSHGIAKGDRIACPYHGVEIRHDGLVTSVPASPGCTLEGSKPTRSFHVREVAGMIFLFNGDKDCTEPPPLQLPEQLTAEEWTNFPCYVEWGQDYRYILENVVDPMHGTFLHKQSHSMSEGDISAKFRIRDLDDGGWIVEKTEQSGVNFDWTEFHDTGIHWTRLEIPYPKTGGPGGGFTIIGCATPISADLTAVVFWRCRQLSGWQRDVYRFLYRNRLESRHWAVLEQDRIIMESMELDAGEREVLYNHDMGVVRLRRYLKNQAEEQLARMR